MSYSRSTPSTMFADSESWVAHETSILSISQGDGSIVMPCGSVMIVMIRKHALTKKAQEAYHEETNTIQIYLRGLRGLQGKGC